MIADSYVVVDLETTGLNFKTEKIIEIGAVKVKNHQIVATYETLMNPGKKLEERIEDLTGIKNEELCEQKPFGEIVDEFMEFMENLPMVAHNLTFDMTFLKKACINENVDFDRPGIDTLKLSRVCLPELEKKTLGFLCEHFSIELKPHRALEDAIATQALYEKLVELYGTKEEFASYFEPKNLAIKFKKEQKASKQQKQHLLEYCEKKGIVPDFDVELLTRNEASRTYDLLVLKHGRI